MKGSFNMTVREYLENEVNECGAAIDTMVEVRHEDTDETVVYMSIDDMLYSGSDYMDEEYISTDKLDDGSYLITIE